MPFGKELSHIIEQQISRAVSGNGGTGSAGGAGVDSGRIALLEANVQRLAEQYTSFLSSQKQSKRNLVDYGLEVLALHDMRLAVTAGRASFADQDTAMDLPYTYLQLSKAGTARDIRYIYLSNAAVVLESTTDPTNIGPGYMPLALVDVWSNSTEITQDKIKDIRPRLGSDTSNNGTQTQSELTGNVTLYSPDTGNDSFIVAATNPAGLKVNVTAGRALVTGEVINAEGGTLDLSSHRSVNKEFIAISDGVKTAYNLFHQSVQNVTVYVDDVVTAVTVDSANGGIAFATAPQAGVKLSASYTFSGNYLLVFLIEKTQTKDAQPLGVIGWAVGSNRQSTEPPVLAPYQHAIAKVNMSSSITAITDAIIDNSYEVTNLTQEDLQSGGKLDGTSLKAGAITGDKLAANTITATKLTADCITSREIHSESVTTEKLAVGAITAAKLAAGAITADKLAAGAITVDKLAAGAVTADKLAAGSVTADKIDASVLALNDNGKTLSAGAVTLNNAGMKVTEISGAYTKFDAKGITWVSAGGLANGAIRRIVSGVVKAGKYVRLNWDMEPVILLSPKSIKTNSANFSGSDVQIVCGPYNVSKDGFRVRSETRLIGGNYFANIQADITPSPFVSPTQQGTKTWTGDTQSGATSCTMAIKLQMGSGDGRDNTSNSVWSYSYKADSDSVWSTPVERMIGGVVGSIVSDSYTLFSGLPSAKYNIRLTCRVWWGRTVDGVPAFATVTSMSCTGGGVISSDGEVSFIAMEATGSNYYSIED